MIEATPKGNTNGLGYRFEDLDLVSIRRDEKTDRLLDPVDHWWLDA
jgi:hypothetical protein